MLFAQPGSDFWTSPENLALCKESIGRQAAKSVQGAERFLFLVMVAMVIYQALGALPSLITALPVQTARLMGFGDSFSRSGAKRRLMIGGFICLPFVLKTVSILGLQLLYTVSTFWQGMGGVALVAWMLAAPHQLETVGYELRLVLLQNLEASSLLGPAIAMLGVAAVGAGTVASYGIMWPTDALYGVYPARPDA